MLVFRRKYPRWWFEFNPELARFVARVVAYLALLDDRYPSADEAQAVHLDIPYPDAGRRPEPLAAAGQVPARDPALHRPRLPLARGDIRRPLRVGRDPRHR